MFSCLSGQAVAALKSCWEYLYNPMINSAQGIRKPLRDMKCFALCEATFCFVDCKSCLQSASVLIAISLIKYKLFYDEEKFTSKHCSSHCYHLRLHLPHWWKDIRVHWIGVRKRAVDLVQKLAMILTSHIQSAWNSALPLIKLHILPPLKQSIIITKLTWSCQSQVHRMVKAWKRSLYMACKMRAQERSRPLVYETYCSPSGVHSCLKYVHTCTH